MSFTVQTDEGVVSAHVPAGAFMDAAANDTMAALEFAVHSVVARDTAAPEHRAKCVVSLSMDPATMRGLVFLLADKSGLPLLNEQQWRHVCTALRYMDVDTSRRDGEELADHIERSWPS